MDLDSELEATVGYVQVSQVGSAANKPDRGAEWRLPGLSLGAGVLCGWGAGCGRAGVGQRSQPAERLGGEPSLRLTRDGAIGRSDGVNRASQSWPRKGSYPGRSIAETTAQNGKTKTISTRELLSTPQG